MVPSRMPYAALNGFNLCCDGGIVREGNQYPSELIFLDIGLYRFKGPEWKLSICHTTFLSGN